MYDTRGGRQVYGHGEIDKQGHGTSVGQGDGTRVMVQGAGMSVGVVMGMGRHERGHGYGQQQQQPPSNVRHNQETDPQSIVPVRECRVGLVVRACDSVV